MQRTHAFIAKLLYVAVFAITTFTFASCKKNDTIPNQQFLGSYSGNANQTGASPASGPDVVVVTAGSNNSSIILTFQSSGTAFNATVSGNNFNLPSQVINGLTGTSEYGSGSVNGDSIKMSLTQDAYGLISYYTFTGAK